MKYLKDKIIRKKASIAVIGVGYVGLPLCLRFLRNRYKVYGIENDKNKIKNIKKDLSYISNITNKEIQSANAKDSK